MNIKIRRLDLGLNRRWVFVITNVIAGVLIAALLLSTSPTFAWYDNAWPYRRELRVDHNLVDADLTDFPLLVSLDADGDLAAKAQADGDDIVFADAGDQKLDHEIEYFDSATGALVAWVRIPQLSSTTDTVLYMYYGNPAASNQENATAVWDDDFVIVQHLNETSGTHFDSTAYANDGAAQNGLIQDATGKVDGADDFPSADEFIDVGADASLDIYGPHQDFSIFTWIKRDNISDVQGFWAAGSTGTKGVYFGTLYQDAGNLRFLSPGNSFDFQSTGDPVGDFEWHHVGVTADRDGVMRFWVDGVPIQSKSMAAWAGADWNRQDDTYKIGTDRSENNPMDGLIDEVRVSRVVRSDAWLFAEYANMSAPGAFLTIGEEQAVDTPVISDESPANGTSGVAVSLSELSFHLKDPEGDSMDFEVVTTPDIGSRSESGVGEGTYTVAVSGLDYETTYSWAITATDGTHAITRTYTFATERDLASISNEAPEDGALYVHFNPILRADLLDEQGEDIEWEIEINIGGTWQTVNSGVLTGGSGTISGTATGADAYDTVYLWRVRARDAGSGMWVEETFSFETLHNEISFAAFADTHVGAMIEAPSWGMAEHMDSLAQDVMSNTMPCDFVLHLGDLIMHSTAYVEGEHLPARYDQYYNNIKAYLIQHVNMPFMTISGNHDLNDYYGESHSGYPENSDDPFKLVRAIIDATEMNSYPYAFMKNNILFLALPETDYHHYTKPIIYEYVAYMTRRYPDNTTIIFSHQAIEDTTIHDGGAGSSYRGKQDRAWWAAFFRNNPQVKMWIHGHQHMLDWYQSDHSTGLAYPVEDFGHEMVFSMPYAQADWGDYFEEDRIVIYSVAPDGISTRTWENNGSGGHWVSGYDHDWAVETTYDENAQDWYSFPVFLQDGEIQVTDMKAFSPKMTLELIGTQPMELFYDPTLATEGTSWGGENILGFGDDEYAEATPNKPGMTVHGPADLDFPPKYPGSEFQGGGSAYHEDGRTGQPYHFFPVGTTHAAVPGATYVVEMTAKSTSGNGRLLLDMSVSDWGTRSQYSTLAGSTQRVISHTLGTTYETITGAYTAPNDADAWFLQGYLNFLDATDYDVTLFSIKRAGDSETTDNFGFSLNGAWYDHAGTLEQYEWTDFRLDPTTMAASDGAITMTSRIDGNQFGMARIIYHAPMLMGRNAAFTVDSIQGNEYSLTLRRDLSDYMDIFKMFPLSKKYGTFEVSSNDSSAAKHTSPNGNEWIESNTPTDLAPVTLDITYGADPPLIWDEQPANLAANVALDPTLSAYINDLQGDAVTWEIEIQMDGAWQTVASGALPAGEGAISGTLAATTYDTTYPWRVSATDAGSGETVVESYQFTTRPANYPPTMTNPIPAAGAVHVALNPTLSIDVDDQDGDLLNVTFETDASGAWQEIATHASVVSGTYTATPMTMAEYMTLYRWRVVVADDSSQTTSIYSFTTRSAPGSWWDQNWLHRKEIIIDHHQVDEDLVDFPFLIELTDADLAAYAQADGDDIAFTDEYGVQLSHEIEVYTATTGHLIAWVRIPELSSTQDTILYMYFGNPAADNQEDVSGTWDDNYVMVHHLAEAAGDHFDSTAYHNDGTTVNVTDQDTSGPIDGADEFDGADDYIRIPDDASLQFGSGSFTAEAWIYPQSIPDSGGARIINNRGTGMGGHYKGYQFKIQDDAGRWRFDETVVDDATGNFMAYDGAVTYPYNQWYHVVMVYDADNEMIVYLNGAVDGNLEIGPYGDLTNNLPTAIGGAIADAGVEGADNKQFFDGVIDEVRLSDIARSAGWISTSYNNQHNDAFYDVGEKESSADPPQIKHPIPADSASDVPLSLSELSFDLYDPGGGSMDYTVIVTPNIGAAADAGVGDGRYTVPLSEALTYYTPYTWTIEVSEGSDITRQTLTFTTEREAGGWYEDAWLYRRMIVIDHTQVEDDLVNFPALIQLTDADLVALAQGDGDDIFFTDLFGVRLDHELEIYTETTGSLIAWVRVPFLSATEDTILYMYYGNLGAENQENAAGVWDEHHVMVQHLEETAGHHFDSTAFANDGTTVAVTDQSAAGWIDGADEFNGVNNYIRVPDADSLQFGAGSFTAEAWIYPRSVPDSGGARIINNRGTGAGGQYPGWQFKIANASGQWQFRDASIDDGMGIYHAYEGTPTYSYDQWYRVAMVYHADNSLQFYVNDGLDGGLVVGEYGDLTNALPTVIGASLAHQGSEAGEDHQFFDGIIDEVRLSDVARSEAWLLTSYHNQSDPDAFASIAEADLALDKCVDDDQSYVGDQVVFTLTLTNDGPDEATTIRVEDQLPAELTLDAASPSVGAYDADVWTVPALPGGDVATLVITATVNAAGSITNTAQVLFADQYDPDSTPGNDVADEDDQDTANLSAIPAADLALTKTASSDVASLGRAITYTLTITNQGPSDAVNVEAIDALPAAVTLGAIMPSQGSCTGAATIICDLGGLAPDAAAIVTMVVTPTTTGTFHNQADVTSDTFDPDPMNNTANIVVDVVHPAIAIAKTPDLQTIASGSAVSFTITVTNTGDVPLSNVQVADPLLPDCTQTLGSMSAGDSLDYVCSASDVSGDFTNSATVTGWASIVGLSVEATDTAFVDVLPTLEVNKTADPTHLPEPGGEVTFTIAVTNTSEETITLTSLLDDVYGDLAGHGTCVAPQAIAAGDDYRCAFSAVVSGNAGDVETDVVTATVSDDESNLAQASADATVAITDLPSEIAVLKSGEPLSVPEPGGNVTFTVRVENLSAVDVVTLESLVDDVYGPLDGQGTCSLPQTLLPGDAYTCTFTETIVGAPGDAVTDTITAAGTDDDGAPLSEDSNPVTITIYEVNEAPVANDDVAATGEDTPLSIDVLTNDTDGDDDPLHIAAVTQPTHGVVTNLTSEVLYTPAPDFNGEDTFTYTASDGWLTDTAQVTITVTPVNDDPVAQDDTAATDEDTPIAIDVLANDTDVDGDPLHIASVIQPAHGAVIHNRDLLTYTPHANFYGQDTFIYTVEDGHGGSDMALVVVTVLPINDAPVATPDAYTVDEGAAMTVTVDAGVLANDSDVEGDPLTATLVSDVAHGALNLQPDGSFTYAHDGSETTRDHFTYQATDGMDDSAVTTVTLHITPVNDAPVARSDAYSVDEGQTLVVPVADGVLNNDSDAEDDVLTAALVDDVTHGVLDLQPDGSFTYTHDGSETTRDHFTYRASDGAAMSNLVTVTLTVGLINDAPVVVDDRYSLAEGAALAADTATGVLANDSDPEGDPLTATLVSDVAHGALALHSDGSFTYTHDGSETLRDHFTYQATDGMVNSRVATVTFIITPVNDAPVAAPNAYSLNEGATLVVSATTGVLANDSDVDSDVLTAVLVSDVAHGLLTLNPDGSFTYAHDGSETTHDHFTYRASDGMAESNIVTVTFTIAPVNDPPIATDDAYTLAEGDTLSVDVTAGLLANDNDVDSETLTVTLVSDVMHGALDLQPDGSFTYTHDGGETTRDTFTYRATDGAAVSNLATVTLTITPVNDPPVAMDDYYTVDEGGALIIAAADGVLVNDVDVDSDTLIATLISDAAHGALDLQSDGSFTYTHDGGETAYDHFIYRVSDGVTWGNTATVHIDIDNVNDAPVAQPDVATTSEDTLVIVDVLANDMDVDGDRLFVVAVTQPNHGATTNYGGAVAYMPAPDFNGEDAFSYTVSDGWLTDTARVSITITPVNDPPVAMDDAATTAEDAPIVIDVLANDTDVDGDALSVMAVIQPAHGVVIHSRELLTYTPTADFHGQDTFLYIASDDHGGTDLAMVVVTVTPVNDPPIVADIPDQSISAGESFATIVLDEYVSDVDNAEAELSWSFGGNVELSVTIADRVATITPPDADWVGRETLVFTATDPGGLAASDAATFTVRVGNHAPIAVADTYQTPEDTPLVIAAPGVLANDEDEDDDALTAILEQSPAHGELQLSADGGFVYMPAADFYGADAFSYRADDGNLTSDIVEVTLTVTPVNDSPTISAIADQSLLEGTATPPIPFTIGDIDTPLEDLTLSAATSDTTLAPPEAFSFGGSGAARTVSIVPTPGLTGTARITITVDDGEAQASTSFRLEVKEFGAEERSETIYLPLITQNFIPAPDLIVVSITATPDQIRVVIQNRGAQAVANNFWVDVYVDPDPIPQKPNDVWPFLCKEGMAWGVDGGLAPGEMLTLLVGDAYYSEEDSNFIGGLAAGTPIYAQVDSANMATDYGGVLEGHEILGTTYNNISGPVLVSSREEERQLAPDIIAGSALEMSALPVRPR